jgi:structure-specific endonuclease subunit SLX1
MVASQGLDYGSDVENPSNDWSQSCSSEAPSCGEDVGDCNLVRFTGCYLLSSQRRPRTYVGFTVNPARRIQQHNGVIPRGGAVRTSVNRPWTMVSIVHGFLTTNQALQFEWAWQNPGKTKFIRIHALDCELQPVTSTRPRFPSQSQQLATLATLLHVPPWSRCPLTITVFVEKDEWREILGETVLPQWVRVNFRPIEFLGSLSDYDYGRRELLPEQVMTGVCILCNSSTNAGRRGTLCVECGSVFHVHCLAAQSMRERDLNLPRPVLLPVAAECANCRRQIPWAEVVRFARVVRRHLDIPEQVITDFS